MCRVFRKTEPSHIKEILVIESGRIGDGIMFLGALRALTKTYISSNYRITLERICKDFYMRILVIVFSYFR